MFLQGWYFHIPFDNIACILHSFTRILYETTAPTLTQELCGEKKLFVNSCLVVGKNKVCGSWRIVGKFVEKSHE